MQEVEDLVRFMLAGRELRQMEDAAPHWDNVAEAWQWYAEIHSLSDRDRDDGWRMFLEGWKQ